MGLVAEVYEADGEFLVAVKLGPGRVGEDGGLQLGFESFVLKIAELAGDFDGLLFYFGKDGFGCDFLNFFRLKVGWHEEGGSGGEFPVDVAGNVKLGGAHEKGGSDRKDEEKRSF